MNSIRVLKYINANPNLKMFFCYYLNNSEALLSHCFNLTYTLSLMDNICEIYELSQKPDYEFNLDETALYILLLSSIFMNFCIDPDDITAKAKSIYEMQKAVDDLLLDDIKNRIKEIVKDNITATVYPYCIEDADLNLYQRILRECSCLSLLETFSIQSMVGYGKAYNEDWISGVSVYLKYIVTSVLQNKDIKLNYVKTKINEYAKSEDILNEMNQFCNLII